MTNLLLCLVEFDWIPYAKRDVKHALGELSRVNPSIFNEDFLRKVRQTIFPLIDKHCESLIERELTNRVQPELFPPGRIIHLYRDGYGMSGSFVPNNFFKEFDVTRRMVDGKSTRVCVVAPAERSSRPCCFRTDAFTSL